MPSHPPPLRLQLDLLPRSHHPTTRKPRRRRVSSCILAPMARSSRLINSNPRAMASNSPCLWVSSSGRLLRWWRPSIGWCPRWDCTALPWSVVLLAWVLHSPLSDKMRMTLWVWMSWASRQVPSCVSQHSHSSFSHTDLYSSSSLLFAILSRSSPALCASSSPEFTPVSRSPSRSSSGS